MDAGYTVLKHTKDDGAYVYGSGAYTYATGITGAGGALNSEAVYGSWASVRFINIVESGSAGLPSGYTTPLADQYMSTGTLIGGATPNGDVRGEGTGYVNVGGATSHTLVRGTNYSGALYAVYEGTNTYTGKVGIGTTTSEITASGFYEGPFTTLDIKEFETVFDVDTGDLISTTTGSGIHLRGDVTLQFGLGDPAGGLVNSSASINASPYISGQIISILDITGGLVYPSYRTTTASTFPFTVAQNADVFGVYTPNFGVRNDVVNYDGTTHRSEIYLYANDLYLDHLYYRASGGTYLNESDNSENFPAPDTGGMSAADAADARKYFNNQLINTTGTTGDIRLDLSFMNDPRYTEFGDMAIWSANSPTNEGNLLGVYNLNQRQQQDFSITLKDGVPEGTPLDLKLAFGTPYSMTTGLYPVSGSGVVIADYESPVPIYLPIEGSGNLAGNLKITDLTGEGGNLSVSGKATSMTGRLKYSDTVEYALTTDITTGCCPLQEVVDLGNTSTTDIYMNGSSIFYINSWIRHVGDANSYFGFPDNDEFRLVTNGQSRLDFTSDGATMYDPLGKSAVEIGKDGYSLQTETSAIIAAYDSMLNSSGCLIGGGSGHQISGDYDVIAGGVTNNISGGDFNFIGGGSQIDLTGSDYSSSIGGKNNDIFNSNYSIVGGGQNNKIESATTSFVGGGQSNEIYAGISAIGGGVSNIISGGNGYAFIGGGEENEVHGTFSSVLGGEGNKIYANDSVTLGGWFTESSGRFALVGPGKASKVSGDYAFALGNKAEIPTGHSGAAVLADGQDRVHASSGAHTATLDFVNGVYVESTSGLFVNGNAVSTGSATETDTLQTVSARGNTTTTSMAVQGQYLSGVSGVFESIDITGTSTLTVTGSVLGTGVGNRITNNGTPYLLSGDSPPDTNTFVTGASFNTSDGVITLSRNDASTVTTDLDGRFVLSSATGAAAPLNVGISNTNLLQANNTLVDNDFLRIDGTQIEGRSASEVLSDIGGQASLTFGISNTNAVKIDSADVADDEYARFTADGLESRSTSEVLSDIGAQASLTFGIANTNAVKIDSASVADNEYARFTSNGLESRSTSEVRSDIGLSTSDSPTFNSLITTGAGGISGGGDFYGTGLENRLTLNGTGYLLSGDASTSLGLGTAATKDVGISNNNVIQANSTLVDNDFLRIDGTQVEGRSASEVLSDIGGQASLTFGIANTNAVKIDSADVADDEYARFTADGLESRSTSEVLSDIGAQASLTFGISNTNAVKIDSASVADDEYARFTSAGLEGRSTSELLGDLSLDSELQNLSSGEIDYLEALYATDVTSTEFDYLDGVSSNIQTQLDAKQASLTFGIADTNAVKIDSATVADNEYARFTADGLESRSTSEVLSDIGGVADGGSPTFNSIYLQNTIFHDGDTDTRIDVSTDTIQLATAGTTALTVASNSNVGVGTDSPNALYKLHTQGCIYATGMVVGSSLVGASIENGLTVEGKTALGYYSTSSTLGLYGNASVGTSYIGTAAPSNGLIVQGNVGIGNSAPTTELDVSGAIKGGFSLSEKSADFTLRVADNGTFINGTSTSFDQITISSDLGAGFNASVLHTGQDVDIVGSSNMIINGTTNGTVTLASGYQPGSIVRLATNTYAVFGNLL